MQNSAETSERRQRRRARRRSYELVAPFYDGIAAVLSRGRIAAAKRSQIAGLKPGDRVLYAGAGAGEDAALAAGMGALVTAVDLSPKMLAQLEGRLGALAPRVEVHCEDFFDHEGGPYDVVVLNFFLNVFAQGEAGQVLDHAVSRLEPDRGRLMIADFAWPQTATERAVYELHYRPLLAASWILGLAAIHPLHDYRAWAQARGFGLSEAHGFAPVGRRFALYESLIFDRRPATDSS